MSQPIIAQRFKGLWLALAALLLLRLLTLGLYPVMETTEARYAEIARFMIVHQDWVTPWFDQGVPFWGKPPASFWLTALSMQGLGINEFAARLPHLLGGLVIAYLTWLLARPRSAAEAVYAPVLLGGSLLFFVASGAVMTDVTLVIGTTLVMYGFWQTLQVPTQRLGRWWLFLGIALGLLAKGPLVLVLVGFPLGVWTLWQRQLGRVWQAFPWLWGVFLACALALPWYALAEQHTPGFLHYFLVGEHWDRFTQSGWKGDLYGTAHARPRGMIWLFALAAFIPWTIILPVAAWWWRKLPQGSSGIDPAWRRYLLIWALTPCLFFTMAGNIIIAYVLPALPAMALLTADWLARRFPVPQVSRVLYLGLAFIALVYVGALVQLGRMDAEGKGMSTKTLIQAYTALHQPQDVLVYSGQRPFSAWFYWQQPIEKIDSDAALITRLAQGSVYAIVETNHVAALQAMTTEPVVVVNKQAKWSLVTLAPKSSLSRPAL